MPSSSKSWRSHRTLATIGSLGSAFVVAGVAAICCVLAGQGMFEALLTAGGAFGGTEAAIDRIGRLIGRYDEPARTLGDDDPDLGSSSCL